MRRAEAGSSRSQPRWLVVAALVLLGARVASGFHEARHPPVTPSLVNWVPLEKAEALARERRLPIVYDFSAEWCEPCKLMNEQVFLDDEAARDINERYIAVRVVDTQEEQGENTPAVNALMKKYSAFGLPTLVIVSPDGAQVDKRTGYQGYTETLRFLRLPTPSSE